MTQDDNKMIGDPPPMMGETSLFAVPSATAWSAAGQVVLDERDPFEAALIKIVTTNRRKRRDYAVDGSPWSSFEFTAGVLGLPAVDAAVHNVAQKLGRLSALRANGRSDEPANETVDDTYLDLAVYAVIALAIRTYPHGKVD